MSPRPSRLAASVAILAIMLAGPLRAQSRPSRRDADGFKQKIAAITAMGEHPSRQLHRTTITERELNAYFAYDVAEDLPAGVVNPAVSIVGGGRLSGRAVVDLDAVRKASGATGLFDPRAYLTGQVPLSVAGVLETSDGRGRFTLESASLGSVPIPKLILQEIVSYYSRTAVHPHGINLDDPFELTAHIREIRVEPGQAIIVQ